MRKGCRFLSSSLQRIRTSTASQSGLKPDVGAALSVLAPLSSRGPVCRVTHSVTDAGVPGAQTWAGRWKRLEH